MTAQIDRPVPVDEHTAPGGAASRDQGRRRPAGRYLVVAVLAVLALVGALVVPAVYARLTDNGTARSRIAADPPPTLFADRTTARVESLTTPQAARAQQL